MTEQPLQSAMKTEQLCRAWWRSKVSFVYAQNVYPCSTPTWRTAKLSDQTHKHWIHPLTWENLKIFKPYSIGQQLLQQSQHRIPFDETALQQQLPTITFIHPLHLIVIHFWLAHRLLAPSFIPICVSTYMHNMCTLPSEQGEWGG